MPDVWRVRTRGGNQNHLVATLGVPLGCLLRARTIGAVVARLAGQTTDLDPSAYGLDCTRWLTEARRVSQGETLVAIVEHYRRAQSLADALEVAGWSWKGTRGDGETVLMVGTGDRRTHPPPCEPAEVADPLGWLARHLPRPSLVLDPVGSPLRPQVDRLGEPDAEGLTLVWRGVGARESTDSLRRDYQVTLRRRLGLWQATFLHRLREGRAFRTAAELTGIDPSTAYKAMKRDEAFAVDVAYAREGLG